MACLRVQCSSCVSVIIGFFIFLSAIGASGSVSGNAIVDCPSTVNITPSAGSPFKAGDVLKCVSDGYRKPSYKWTDSKGFVVSAARTTKLREGPFNLTCTATDNVTASCSASSSISGTAIAASEESGGDRTRVIIIAVVVSFVGLLIIVIIVVCIVCICRKRGKCRRKEANRPANETNIEMNNTGDIRRGLPRVNRVQESDSIALTDAEQPQYAEFTSRPNDAMSSSLYRTSGSSTPDDVTYSAVRRKASNQ